MERNSVLGTFSIVNKTDDGTCIEGYAGGENLFEGGLRRGVGGKRSIGVNCQGRGAVEREGH